MADDREKGAIPVSDARAIGEKSDVQNIVIFALNKDTRSFTVTTWGKTKALCAWAAKIGDDIFKAVFDGFVCNGSAHAENPYEENAALRTALKELWQAADTEDADTLEMAMDRIAAAHPFVKEDDND